MPIPKEIKVAAKNNSFGIYVGAGLSRGAGLPSWGELLTELIHETAQRTSVSKDRLAEFETLSQNPARYLMLAEELREVLGDADLQKFIQNRFDDKGVKPTSAQEKIVKLKSKFILTTNYDTLLEKSFVKIHPGEFPSVYTYKSASAINYRLWNDDYFILKAHGDARNAPSEIILTEKDYRKIIYKEHGYQSVLHAIFSSYTMLFVGASISDPELMLLLGFIHNVFHGGSPLHFALMDETTLTSTEIDRWRKDFNIAIIPYNPRNNHIEIENFIDEAIAEIGELTL